MANSCTIAICIDDVVDTMVVIETDEFTYAQTLLCYDSLHHLCCLTLSLDYFLSVL